MPKIESFIKPKGYGQMFLGLAVVEPLSRDLGLVLEDKPFHNPVPPLLQLWFPEAPLTVWVSGAAHNTHMRTAWLTSAPQRVQ